MRKKRRKKLHPTGQLSIFAILMFQMLFILFAMSLNVALVVHDKINLQNSVDLAAYYGAMKQAEMMNAIAHINYQIRQSWKLFVWRYRVLGNMGLAQVGGRYSVSSNGARNVLPLKGPPPGPGPYFFCVGHNFWNHLTSGPRPAGFNDNLCADMETTIAPISVPAVRGFLGDYYNLMRETARVSEHINYNTADQCNIYGYNSWLLGTYSVISFRRDQSVRKFMIKTLAEAIQGGKDLDEGLIERGVENTFRRNLNFINGQNFRPPLKQWNSLSRQGVRVDQWLKDTNIVNGQRFLTDTLYAQLSGSTGTGCTKRIEYLQRPTPYIIGKVDFPNLNLLLSYDNRKWPNSCEFPYQCDPSAGIYKVPTFMVFYGVGAELDYKDQIFLPGGRNLKLKAQAFAKPFGGRIGPPPGTDFILNDRGSWSGLPLPNYSRYPGDRVGLRSNRTQYAWRYIMNDVTSAGVKNIKNYMKNSCPNDPDPLSRTDSVLGGCAGGGDSRKWEMQAIAPDLFDTTYFTILPYYQHTYFGKVKELMERAGYRNVVRGDLGYLDNNFFKEESILSQVNEVRKAPYFLDVFYKIKNAGNREDKPVLLLTGWNPPKQKYSSGGRDYMVNQVGDTNFGKCNMWANSNISQPKGKIANGCVYGGRSGYSVKMLSKDVVQNRMGGDRTDPPIPSSW